MKVVNHKSFIPSLIKTYQKATELMDFYINYVEEPEASDKKYYGCLAKE